MKLLYFVFFASGFTSFAANAQVATDSQIASVCNQNDQAMIATLRAHGAQFPNDQAGLIRMATDVAQRLSPPCQALMQPRSNICSPAQIQRMIAHNSTVQYPNHVETDCSKF